MLASNEKELNDGRPEEQNNAPKVDHNGNGSVKEHGKEPLAFPFVYH